MAFFKYSTLALLVTGFGILSFVFGVVAENKKPAKGIPIGKDVITCKFPSDPTVAMGTLSFVSLTISTIFGLASVYYSYEGVSVPKGVLFKSTSLLVFFGVALAVTALGGAMMLWATITESLHRIHNGNHPPGYECPTAKTGLFGGAAFLALDASLFWLICQMLTQNSRADYLEEDTKGDYGEVIATDYEAKVSNV